MDKVDALQAEVAALRAELAAQRLASDQAMTRRRLLTGFATVGAAGAASVAAATPAAAADGDGLVLGTENTASSMTTLRASTPGFSGFNGVLWIEQEGEGEALTVIQRNGDYAIAAFGGVECISAQTDGLIAVVGRGTGAGIGVSAQSVTSPALYMYSASGAHMAFQTGSDLGPPSNGVWEFEKGNVRMDSNADLWVCTAEGPPPQWTRLLREDQTAGRVMTMSPAVRVLGTRGIGGRPAGSPAVPGQVAGPLSGGQVVTLDLAGVAGVPANATAVVGNATVLDPSADGYIRILPAGTSSPASTVQFKADTAVANSFTCALGANGLTIDSRTASTITYHLSIDITAYIT